MGIENAADSACNVRREPDQRLRHRAGTLLRPRGRDLRRVSSPRGQLGNLRSDAYYVDMMRAWYFAEALLRQEASALPYLERKGTDALLDEWTRRKAIQKAIESRRVSDTLKDWLRLFR